MASQRAVFLNRGLDPVERAPHEVAAPAVLMGVRVNAGKLCTCRDFRDTGHVLF